MNNLQYPLDLIRKTRENIVKVLSQFSIEELNQIPENYNNNLAWNFAHVVVTQQILCYKMSGLTPYVNADIIEAYRKGSKPEHNVSEQFFNQLKQLSTESINQFEADYESGLFQDFKTYRTSYGVELKSVEDAVQFNIAHEAMHLGTIMAMRKAF